MALLFEKENRTIALLQKSGVGDKPRKRGESMFRFSPSMQVKLFRRGKKGGGRVPFEAATLENYVQIKQHSLLFTYSKCPDLQTLCVCVCVCVCVSVCVCLCVCVSVCVYSL